MPDDAATLDASARCGRELPRLVITCLEETPKVGMIDRVAIACPEKPPQTGVIEKNDVKVGWALGRSVRYIENSAPVFPFSLNSFGRAVGKALAARS
eukprot:1147248-Pleurochrysis_carterae.AAC.2